MEKYHSLNPRDDIDPTQLRLMFSYSPETGFITKNGRRVGWDHPTGYRYLSVQGREYKEHRVAWAIHFGRWPRGQIDHSNRVRSDNRLANLREASAAENQANVRIRTDNKTGFSGVFFRASINKFVASVRLGGKKTHLGYFSTAEEANEAVLEAKAKR